MDMKKNITNRYWHVHITTPPEEGKNRYSLNHTFGVVAVTADDAITQVRANYPDATIWSVQHRGSVDFGIIEHNHGYHESDLTK